MSEIILSTYLAQIEQTLPRLLAMFDVDRTSRSHGMGDRYYWAWGLIDFGNGTFQGAAHGLARLWRHGLWPYSTSKEQFMERMNALFHGAKNLTRQDGSLEEAFPHEGSYCVTALVAFDLLVATNLLDDDIDAETKTRWQQIIAPMIDFLLHGNETHAIISNHIATAVAALVRWHHLTGDEAVEVHARMLMDRILSHQSPEGWFREYDGADPGYQSLCTYYLADVHQMRPDWGLLVPLSNSIRFLWFFAHPDGSFGGHYGSRCTRFYYPAGIMALAGEVPEARTLAAHMIRSIRNLKVVTLLAMDEPNLVPMFNAYCWAAVLSKTEMFGESEDTLELPALSSRSFRQYFQQAGLFLDRGAHHYTVISVHKGGVVRHFINGYLQILDDGPVIRNSNGQLGSTQSYSENNKMHWENENGLRIESSATPMPKQLPGPLQFIALRIFCVTAFRSSRLREWVKQQLVKLLITGGKPWPVKNRRTIILGEMLKVTDQLDLPAGYAQVGGIPSYVPIHMASQGYWQSQDEERMP
ncbi:MAG: hypothetical protein HQL55_13280 [Magnetococcales bacterium]|nr:hypothetical protein [Magnetococcales bacterium]